jgi:4-hydroxy-tetrahydrodipicolinate synthase
VLAVALADLPFVAAVKAEAPPTPPAIAALTSRLTVPVFGGLGGIGLLDELAAGSAGAMTGFSFPEGLLACVSAFRSGGYEAAREAFLPYLPLVNFEQQVRIALAVRKEALRRRGLIAEAAVRAPAAAFPTSLSQQLDRHLAAVPTLERVR